MALSNIFSPKKPKYQASGYGSQYSQPSSYASPMSSQTAGASAQPVTRTTAPTSTTKYVMPTQAKAPTQNYSMASGMDTRYGQNPTNYVAPTYKVPTTTTGGSGSNYINTLQKSGQEQMTFAEKLRQQNEEYTKQQYGLLNQGLDNSAGQYKGDFDRFKANSEAGIRDIQATGETQKSNAKDYYGEAQLQAAKSRNQVRGETQRTFSNLNTLDSRGEGSFSQATENQDSQFNSFTQGNLKAQAQKLTEIDMQVGQAVRSATQAIQQEESKLNGLLQQIQLAKSQNNLDQAKSLTDAYNQTQQRIYDIQDGIDNIKYQYELEQEKFAQAQEALSAETQGLSPEFLQSGQVKTMQDFIYRSKHPEMYEKVAASAGPAQGNGKVLGMIDKLLATDTKPITGLNRIVIPGTDASTTQASWDGLKSLLTLAERGQLKGSGAVSDFETKILEKAAAAGLDPRMDDAAFRSRLQEIKNELSGGATQSSQVRVISPDGQVGMIDSSELQQALASGWRQS